MAEKFRFMDPVLLENGTYDREYNAQEFTDYFKALVTTGVMKSVGGQLGVTANGNNMVTSIANGIAFILGRYYENDGVVNLTHDTETLGNSRIDRIVIRMDLSPDKRHVLAFIKKGAPSANPVAPLLTQTANIYEISLAQIRVVGGQTFIATNAVTDERGTNVICPWAGSNILPSYDDNALSQHINNQQIHVTQAEQDKWDKALQPNTQSDNEIINLGVNFAVRKFPTISFNKNDQPESLEIIIPVQDFWGIIELELTSLFANSNAGGGAKIIYQIGKNASNSFINRKTIISMNNEFASNFYIPDALIYGDNVYLFVHKRTYNNPLIAKVSIQNTSTLQNINAFNALNNAFTQVLPMTGSIQNPVQKDLDARITENFTLFSNGKAVVNQAVTDMGVYTAPDAPFATTAANIRSLSASAFGNGTATSSGGNTVISIGGLAFQPRVINISFPNGGSRIIYNPMVSPQADVFAFDVASQRWNNYTANVQLTNNGFTITAHTSIVGPYRWEAFK